MGAPNWLAVVVSGLGRRKGSGVHLRTISTKGAPLDSGEDLYGTANKFLKRARPYFDSVGQMTFNEARKTFTVFQAQISDLRAKERSSFESSAQVRWNQSWAAVGHLVWKPLAIRYWLEDERVPPGDILFYHDCNFRKYPEYLVGLRRQRHYLREKLNGKDFAVFTDYERPLSEGIRGEILNEYLDSSDHHNPRVWAGAVAIRKTAAGHNFVDEWISLCSPENLSPISQLPQQRNFIWHTGEQAMLTLEWYRRRASDPDAGVRLYLGEGRMIPPRNETTRRFVLSFFALRVRAYQLLKTTRKYFRIGLSSRPFRE